MGVCVLDFGVNDVVQFDIERTLTPTLETEATEYPVESGSVYSDSLIRRPRMWEINALVSNTPLTDTLNPRLQNGQTRVSAVWSRLVQAWQNRQTFAYSDDMDGIPVAVITNVSAPRNAENQNALEMTLTVKEILIATAQRAKLVRVPSNGKRRQNGTDSPKQVDPAVAWSTLWDGANAEISPLFGRARPTAATPQSLKQPGGIPGPSPQNIPSATVADTVDIGDAFAWQ